MPSLPETGRTAKVPEMIRIVLLVLLLVPVLTGSVLGQAFNDFDLPPHNYYENERKDPMSRLLERVERGEYRFGKESGLPLLRRLLAELEIPESSQVLVFSQTSLQRGLIGPANPRALYFNEHTHVGWMPEGKIEIISFDADSGGRFFIEEPAEEPGTEVTFVSHRRCFGCHGGSATNFLPGPLARSNFTSETGRRLGGVPGHDRLSHEVPFASRWGGYFVTGAPPTLAHLGNAFAVREARELSIDDRSRRSLESLDTFFDRSHYPRGDSSIVPLLVFDHQIEAHNLIIEARHRDRQFSHERGKFDGGVTGKTRKDTEAFFDRFVRYFLFADEVSLAGHEIVRNPEFEEDFRANRKAAPGASSLKDFDLETRMFRNRLSYMIQSDAFIEAPGSMRNRVYERLWRILAPEQPPSGFGYFEEGERERILEILRSTHPDLPDSWRKDSGKAAGVASTASVPSGDR